MPGAVHLTPRTVPAHLYRNFPKPAIISRAALRALPAPALQAQTDPPASPATDSGGPVPSGDRAALVSCRGSTRGG